MPNPNDRPDQRRPQPRDDRRDDRRSYQGEVLPKQRAARIDPATIGLPTKPTTDVATLGDALVVAERRGCNVLAPVTELQFIPVGFQAAVRMIVFPTDGQWDGRSNGLWYETDGGKLALHRGPLDQLASLAGLSWDYVRRVDDGTVPLLWAFEAAATLCTFDGTRRQVIRNRVLDLRDGSPEIVDMIEAANRQQRGAGDRISKARLHGAALCETKATSRVVRAALGLRGSYSKVEAAQPFVFPTLIFVPDMDDPEVRRMVTASALGIVRTVYGPGAPGGPVLHAPGTIVDVVDRDDGDGRDDDPDNGREAPAQQRGQQQRGQQQRLLPDNGPPRDLEAELREAERKSAARVPVEREAPREAPRQQAREPERPASKPGPMSASLCCVECGAPITQRVADYSRRHFNEPLCFDHQPRQR